MPDPEAVNTMFGRIAPRYDVANRLLSGGIDLWWRRRLVRTVRKGNPRDVLDLATGSGDVAFALSSALAEGTRIIGMDFCQPMLDEAERKKVTAGPNAFRSVEFMQGDGMALPLPDATFDAVTISFGLRNMADRHKSLTEMHRVLRPGGRLVVLEFSQPARWFRPLYYFYLRRLLPGLAGLITGDRPAYQYLNDTIAAFPDRMGLRDELLRAGFVGVSATGLTFGIVAIHEGTK